MIALAHVFEETFEDYNFVRVYVAVRVAGLAFCDEAPWKGPAASPFGPLLADHCMEFFISLFKGSHFTTKLGAELCVDQDVRDHDN